MIHEQRVGHFRTFVILAVLLPAAILVGMLARPPAADASLPGHEGGMLAFRALGVGALFLLHAVLCIGPLARLSPRFLPLLYNRRRLGLATFALGLAHGAIAVVRFHGEGPLPPLVSVLVGRAGPDGAAPFPFQALGLAALLVLLLMAVTSHDFWLANLTAPFWKSLHMAVYIAYALLVMHVVLGALQREGGLVTTAALGAGVTIVVLLHLVTGWREVSRDVETLSRSVPEAPWVEVGAAADIPEKRARILFLSGERVAVFRYDGRISAVSNVCPHQAGPLGEGRILDGCIVCPWHGRRYAPDSGRAPAPFPERVPTFGVRVVNGRVWIDPRPNAPGTPVEPARFDE